MKIITSPLDKRTIESLKAGDMVALSGIVYTARDQAHKRLVGLINEGRPLPVALEGQTIYYTGPAPARPGAVVGSIGPTTSARMDPYTPVLLDYGVKAMIGKGARSPGVIDSIKQAGAVYLVATGGAAAYLAQFVVSAHVAAFADLGPEAIFALELAGLPLVVAIDSQGRSALWPDAS
ncbi:MAG: FumA C-terminus/TtdB family hydratase beta subunit [Actinomycetota bacterium]|nr:FumA C-terminus/TtdB family hydratase beta subunit [Actinomycetota bacterium]